MNDLAQARATSVSAPLSEATMPQPPTPPRVLVGTPAYGGMVHTDFVDSVLQYSYSGVPFNLMTIGNESLITRARNTILAAFHIRKQFTHLLFLDGDVLLPAAGLKQLLSHHCDVIGAAVALKGVNPDGSRIFNFGRCIGERGSLYLTERLGTAALMLSRRAVDALIADAIAHARAYNRPSTTRGDMDAPVHYDVFRVGVVGDEYLSEDFYACYTLRKLGFDIHVDPTIVTRHHGQLAM
jgi:hypothetical protein